VNNKSSIKKSTIFFILCLGLLAVFLGYAKYKWIEPYRRQKELEKKLIEESKPAQITEAEAAKRKLSEQADQLLFQLTADQKIAQIISVPFAVGELASLSASLPGFVTLSGMRLSAAQVATATSSLQEKNKLQSKIPVAIAVDHEGGSLQRLSGKGFTVLPSWSSLCLAPDLRITTQLSASAKELRQAGVNIVFGPVVDLLTFGSGGTVGGSPSSSGSAAIASGSSQIQANSRLCSLKGSGLESVVNVWANAFAEQNIISTGKYFSLQNKNIFEPILKADPQLSVITTTHVVGTEKLPCALDKKCVAEIPPSDDRLIFTEAIETTLLTKLIAAQSNLKNFSQVASEAIKSGNTVVILGSTLSSNQIAKVRQDLLSEYQTSAEFKAQVDAKVSRVIRQKIKMGLLP
jgi:hypothetical protein